MTQGHPCFGLAASTLCQYDPANPGITYFGVGEAIAALALTLAVRNFLKPVFIFRLSNRGFRLYHIYALCFSGFLFAVTASALPNLPVNRSSIFAYPIFWELVASASFASAYAIIAFGSAVTVKLQDGKYERFARALANYLSEQESSAYTSIADEILLNLPDLIRKSAFYDQDWQRRTAFYEFTHRRTINDASYAASLIDILSDEKICAALVEGSPWRLARTLKSIEELGIRSHRTETLVQQIATQAIFSDNSIMKREIGFTGFSRARVFSDALFGSNQICRLYRPLHMLKIPKRFESDSAERLCLAMKLMLRSTFSSPHHWDVLHIYDLQDVIRDLIWKIPRSNNGDVEDYDYYIGLSLLLRDAARECRMFLRKHDRSVIFFSEEEDVERFDLKNRHVVNAVTEMCMQFIDSISNDFKGPSDQFWSSMNGLWHEIFPIFSSREPDGFDAFQQHMALRLAKSVDENIKGFYPAVSRVLLSMTGPYRSVYPKNRSSAAGLMEDGFYAKIRNFRKVRESHYMRREKLLPDHVEYDAGKNTLSFLQAGNVTSVPLSRIRPRAPDWLDRRHWQTEFQQV